MKTLNDSLREEFAKELSKPELLDKLNFDDLDTVVLNKAFDILLKFKSDDDLIDKARGEFETFLINHFRNKMNQHDN